jgi:hypothetical protein
LLANVNGRRQTCLELGFQDRFASEIKTVTKMPFENALNVLIAIGLLSIANLAAAFSDAWIVEEK